MRSIGSLSLYASRLLNAYWELGDAAPHTPVRVLIEMCNIKGNDHLYNARTELVRNEFLAKHGRIYTLITMSTAEKNPMDTLMNSSINSSIGLDKTDKTDRLDSSFSREIETTSLEIDRQSYLSRGPSESNDFCTPIPVVPVIQEACELEHLTETTPTGRKTTPTGRNCKNLHPQVESRLSEHLHPQVGNTEPTPTGRFPTPTGSNNDDRTSTPTGRNVESTPGSSFPTPTGREADDRTSESTPTGRFPISPDSLLDRCEVVDAEPADGDKLVKSSNFQVRRRKQVELAKEAWKVYFPSENALVDTRARAWLAITNDSVFHLCAVLEEMSKKTIKSPLTYIDKVLRNKAAKGEFTRPIPMSTAKTEYEKQIERDRIQEGEKRKPTSEEIEEIRRFRAKYAKS